MSSDVRVKFFVIFTVVVLLSPAQVECNLFSKGLTRMMGYLQQAKTYMAGDTICQYTCANGGTPTPNPNHKNSANGCGSYGFQLDTSRYPDLTRCCDTHDYCYGKCGSVKHECDRTLRDCLQRTCDNMNDSGILTHKGYVSCSELSKMMYEVVYLVGCEAFVTGQDCEPC